MFKTLIASAVASIVVCTLPAHATSWDLANEYPPTSLQGQAAEVFSKAVEEKTGGSVKITVHHGGSLGYKSVDHFDAVGDGALQAASSTFVAWPGIDPIFQLSSLPFLAPKGDDAWRLYEIARPEYEKVFEDNNQVFLFATPWPSSGLWGRKNFEIFEDLKGAKVRTYDVGSTETMRAAGAFPVQISWGDVAAQLQTGGIDSVLTSANGGIGIQMWDQQSHFTNVNYAASLQPIHVNKDAWDALSADEQEAVRAAAAEAEAFGWELLKTSQAQDYEILRKNNVTVLEEVTPEFAEALTQTGKPIIDAWVSRTGDRATRIMDAYTAK